LFFLLLATEQDGVPLPEFNDGEHQLISLTSHPDAFGVDPVPISWGHPDAKIRGPVICTVRHSAQRNAIGAHSGSYCIYTGLAVAAGKLDPAYVPNLSLTSPVFPIGPHPSWSDPKKIGALDPFGHLTTVEYADWLEKGWDIRPTIAVTKAHIDLPECREAIAKGRLIPDGKILLPSGQSIVAKAAIEPVWYLPEIARRFQTTESNLRQSIFSTTNGMYPELITRPDIKIFLPPIGGLTIYIWGDPNTIPDEDVELTCRVHDECNGSDVFGSDICTCRPYLTHAIEECIKTAQRGGCGVVIYYRKEGRSLGEVTKVCKIWHDLHYSFDCIIFCTPSYRDSFSSSALTKVTCRDFVLYRFVVACSMAVSCLQYTQTARRRRLGGNLFFVYRAGYVFFLQFP
jgi:GTP cyclohydrolase II